MISAQRQLRYILGWALVASTFAWSGELRHVFRRMSLEDALHAVVSELRSRGVAENALPRLEDVELPVAVPARAESSLRVSSAVCWDAEGGRVRFRLECVPAGSCLPFLVYVRMPPDAQAPACLHQATSHPVAAKSAPVVHAGERAMAFLVASGIHVTAAVTCLDRGRPGEIIRVRGQEGHIFRARVSGPALVEALTQ